MSAYCMLGKARCNAGGRVEGGLGVAERSRTKVRLGVSSPAGQARPLGARSAENGPWLCCTIQTSSITRP